MTAWPTVALTGHRPKYLAPAHQAWVRTELERLALKLRDDHGMTVGLSGMALGADLWWADATVRAGMRLHAHVPFPQQPAVWADEARAEWQRLLGHAEQTFTYGTGYSVQLLHARNRGMVDGATQLVGVWRFGKQGGTWNALDYAVRQGLRPIWVDPEKQRTCWPEVDSWRAMLAVRSQRRAA